MQKLRILIVGGGIAGAAAAAFLGRDGHAVTVLERGERARSSGSPVDVRDAGLAAAQALGVTARLREHDTGARSLAMIGPTGRPFARIRIRTSEDDIEIARRDLSAVLLEAASQHARIRYGETFDSLTVTSDGVDAVLGGVIERYDLVVGADGQHSATRRALWPVQERGAGGSLGLGIATVEIPDLPGDRETVEMRNEPSRALALHPAGGRPGAAFLFRHSGPLPDDAASQRALLHQWYAGFGWHAPVALAALAGAQDFYFDAVQRVRVRAWSRDRAVLLGDAASSITLLGEGSSMALAGAQVLGRALAGGRDIAAALRRYESELRPLVERKQSGAGIGAGFLVPRTRAGLALRNVAVRTMRRV
ncbi:FAD-dependent monooxygenase [Microbacterium sp. 22242]|uniref:FAD-dependent monooxygenase n=1 Tax=Microbacterium sp. 22242 TaxID=3453896 RepID=UPI003F82AAD3